MRAAAGGAGRGGGRQAEGGVGGRMAALTRTITSTTTTTSVVMGAVRGVAIKGEVRTGTVELPPLRTGTNVPTGSIG